MISLSTLITLAKSALGISLIIAIHELGHMLFAKWFGIRVEEYMIGFPPKIASIQWGETEYSLGAIPLGGFVEIDGMLDESLDSTSIAQVVQPWEFRSKPVWQRLIVMLGGILFNLISAFLIYTCLLFIVGTPYLSKEVVNKHGISPTELGVSIGLQRGDKIININGKDFTKFSELSTALDSSPSSYYTILRNSQELRIEVPKDTIATLKKTETTLMNPLIPFKVGQIIPNSGAYTAGLQPGDKIVTINDKPINYFQDLNIILASYANQFVKLQFCRAGTLYTTKIKVNACNELGFDVVTELAESYTPYSLPQATIHSIGWIRNTMAAEAKGIGKVITGKVAFSASINGPIFIASLFGKSRGLYDFFFLLALFSVLVTFMNLLPIPVSDGGYALFLLYEIVAGKRLSDYWYKRLQIIGMVLLGGLMSLVLLSDLLKYFNLKSYIHAIFTLIKKLFC